MATPETSQEVLNSEIEFLSPETLGAQTWLITGSFDNSSWTSQTDQEKLNLISQTLNKVQLDRISASPYVKTIISSSHFERSEYWKNKPGDFNQKVESWKKATNNFLNAQDQKAGVMFLVNLFEEPGLNANTLLSKYFSQNHSEIDLFINDLTKADFNQIKEHRDFLLKLGNIFGSDSAKAISLFLDGAKNFEAAKSQNRLEDFASLVKNNLNSVKSSELSPGFDIIQAIGDNAKNWFEQTGKKKSQQPEPQIQAPAAEPDEEDQPVSAPPVPMRNGSGQPQTSILTQQEIDELLAAAADREAEANRTNEAPPVPPEDNRVEQNEPELNVEEIHQKLQELFQSLPDEQKEAFKESFTRNLKREAERLEHIGRNLEIIPPDLENILTLIKYYSEKSDFYSPYKDSLNNFYPWFNQKNNGDSIGIMLGTYLASTYIDYFLDYENQNLLDTTQSSTQTSPDVSSFTQPEIETRSASDIIDGIRVTLENSEKFERLDPETHDPEAPLSPEELATLLESLDLVKNINLQPEEQPDGKFIIRMSGDFGDNQGGVKVKGLELNSYFNNDQWDVMDTSHLFDNLEFYGDSSHIKEWIDNNKIISIQYFLKQKLDQKITSVIDPNFEFAGLRIEESKEIDGKPTFLLVLSQKDSQSSLPTLPQSSLDRPATLANTNKTLSQPESPTIPLDLIAHTKQELEGSKEDSQEILVGEEELANFLKQALNAENLNIRLYNHDGNKHNLMVVGNTGNKLKGIDFIANYSPSGLEGAPFFNPDSSHIHPHGIVGLRQIGSNTVEKKLKNLNLLIRQNIDSQIKSSDFKFGGLYLEDGKLVMSYNRKPPEQGSPNLGVRSEIEEKGVAHIIEQANNGKDINQVIDDMIE